MFLKFAKMQALGNDFVVLDGVSQELRLRADDFRRLGDRRLGVGCDQILIVDPAPNAQADFGYRIYNADGSEVGQCGNGARCLARFVERKGLSDKQQLRVATQTTMMNLQLLEHGWVRADLDVPQFEPANIPLARSAVAMDYVLESAMGPVRGGAVSVGNPHFVIPVENVDTAPVQELGSALTAHADFPQGVNVGFVQIVAPDHLRLRVYERGVGETPACGSGACAAAIVMRHWGRSAARVVVELPGGELRVQWDEGQAVVMEGPADWVYEGEIEL